MPILKSAYAALFYGLTPVLRLGRALAWMALGLMVLIILMQVVFRYLPFLDALNWPEEAARFLMLWLTGLCAPSALRWGGFVAIDMVPRAVGGRMGGMLVLFLQLIALVVLITAVQLGFKHVNSGWLFKSSSLMFFVEIGRGSLENLSFGWMRMQLAFMYLSLFVGFVLMLLVNIELILKSVILLISPDETLPSDRDAIETSGD